ACASAEYRSRSGLLPASNQSSTASSPFTRLSSVTIHSAMNERLIDANVNRASEALRVLEDVARFQLDDAKVAVKLKDIRSSLRLGYTAGTRALLSARDTGSDPGAASEEPQVRNGGLPTLILA